MFPALTFGPLVAISLLNLVFYNVYGRIRRSLGNPILRFVPKAISSKKLSGIGKIAIITGSNTGIGYETALALTLQGYTVIIASRSPPRARDAVSSINSKVAAASSGKLAGTAIFLTPLDLTSIASIRAFAAKVQATYTNLHVLVNNAGINNNGESGDGFDLCFQTNFLGHFLLTTLLLPLLLVKTEGSKDDEECARIVSLSSVMHHFAQPRLTHSDWLHPAMVSCRDNTYSDSKLASVLFSLELNRRYGDKGVRAISCNPGAVNSEIWRHIPKVLMTYFLEPIFRAVYLNCKDGAATTIACVLLDSDEIGDGIYLQPYHFPSLTGVKKYIANVPLYNTCFPSFEMLGWFAGYSFMEPRLPGKDGGVESGEALWAASETLLEGFELIEK